MIYSLSTQVITDTVHAIVAIELLTAPPSERHLLSPLTDPSRRGMLTLMIKNAFAETVLDLLPYVDDASLDSEEAGTSPSPHPVDDAADHLLQISLRVPVGAATFRSGGLHGILRRQMEMAVVLRVIHTAVIAAAGSAAPDSAVASRLASRLKEQMSAITAFLATNDAGPFIRQRFP